MSDEKEAGRDSYQRQRRNLFITSFALLTIQCAGVKLESLAIQGYLFRVDNPEYIFWALVCLTIYFFVRCYQYYFEYFRGALEAKIHNLLFKHPSCIEQMIKDYYLKHRDLLPKSRNNSGIDIHLDSYEDVLFNQARQEWVIRNPAIRFSDSDGDLTTQYPVELIIPDSILKTSRQKAKYAAVIDTPAFTEHYLPFYFALAVLIIAVPWRIASYDWMSQIMISIYH